MTALYHQHHQGPLHCAIAIDHGDGTVSLARTEGKAPFVRCPLRAKPAVGCATRLTSHVSPLTEPEPEPPRRKPKRPPDPPAKDE